MRIGICDDNARDCRELKEILSDVRTEDEIMVLFSGNELLDALHRGDYFDILFLDIYLPDMKGTQIAQKLREIYPDRQPFLVFVTTSLDFAVQAFALRAVHYLVKPIQKQDVIEVFERIPSVHDVRHGITVKFRESSRFLFLDEIAYCESFGHKVNIYLNQGETIAYYETLRNLKGLLGAFFLQITRGLLVNMDYIEIMKSNSCILRNGREVLLSRRNRKEIHEQYQEYVFSKMLQGNKFEER